MANYLARYGINALRLSLGIVFLKNLVLISAGLVLGATVRGGTLVAEVEVRRAM